MPYLLIDPDETLDYARDWSGFLDDGGSPSDSILSATWTITPQEASPQAPVLSNPSNTATTAKVFVTGAVYGQVYRLANRIVTAQGRAAERSITLRCEHK